MSPRPLMFRINVFVRNERSVIFRNNLFVRHLFTPNNSDIKGDIMRCTTLLKYEFYAIREFSPSRTQ
jgi:hypothetical protein